MPVAPDPAQSIEQATHLADRTGPLGFGRLVALRRWVALSSAPANLHRNQGSWPRDLDTLGSSWPLKSFAGRRVSRHSKRPARGERRPCWNLLERCGVHTMCTGLTRIEANGMDAVGSLDGKARSRGIGWTTVHQLNLEGRA